MSKNLAIDAIRRVLFVLTIALSRHLGEVDCCWSSPRDRVLALQSCHSGKAIFVLVKPRESNLYLCELILLCFADIHQEEALALTEQQSEPAAAEQVNK